MQVEGASPVRADIGQPTYAEALGEAAWSGLLWAKKTGRQIHDDPLYYPHLCRSSEVLFFTTPAKEEDDQEQHHTHDEDARPDTGLEYAGYCGTTR